MDPPIQSIEEPLKDSEKLSLVRDFCNKDINALQLAIYNPYIAHYMKQIASLSSGIFPEQKVIANRSVQSHQELRNLAAWLFRSRSVPLTDLCRSANSELSVNGLQKSIELIVRIGVFLNVRNDMYDYISSPTLPIDWPKDMSLTALIEREFPASPISSIPNRTLPQHFKMSYLIKICGVKLEWTTCLADHLRTRQTSNHTAVRIFHLKHCLEDHMNGRGALLEGSPLLPVEMLRQAIWTINVLFPEHSSSTQKMLRKLRGPGVNLNAYDWSGEDDRPTALQAYTYWHSRLEKLLEVHQAGPKTTKQYFAFLKQYEKLSWLVTVVVAFVLAVIFGVISCATAILSLRRTTEALEVARQAYQLQKNTPVCPCT